ncbi:hypothetical protein [Desertibaculum subflavum]|uniref:hypothetical protein n=1 Tax=Desertibaculum subflavum TaxID=2268458 RepID=UPI000E66D71B
MSKRSNCGYSHGGITGAPIAAALALVCVGSLVGNTGAQTAKRVSPIVLEVTAPKPGEVFACRIPVTVRAPEDLRALKIAKVYDGDVALASTGIATGVRPLIAERRGRVVGYESVPLQFDMTEGVCERVTELHLVLARCTFDDGETTDCLDRVRFQPSSAGELSFHVGEPSAGEVPGEGG